jgi:phage-related protein
LDSGREPVREWLKDLSKEERKTIGEDVKTLQFGWPVGMPLARKLAPELWEVRSSLGSRIARVIFTVFEQRIVLLHGFAKKTRKTPPQDLALAKRRLRKLRE